VSHALAAVLLAGGLGAGLLGLGGRLGGTGVGERWLRGWTLLWWIVALAASVAGPRTAAALGLAVGALGAVALAISRDRPGRAALALAAALGAGAPLWLLPPTFYDTLVYHLGLPWSWLINASFDPIEHHVFSHFPLAGSTVFLLPVAVGLPEVAAALHLLTFAAVLVTAARVARALGAGRWAALAPVLVLGCWHAVWVASVAAADHLVLLGIAVALERLAAGERGMRAAVAFGLALGLAAAAKYAALVPVAAILAAGVTVLGWRTSLLAGGVAAGVSSFWWLRNLLTTGNPVYPLLFGGRGWSPADAERWASLVHEGVADPGGPGAGLARLVVPPGGLGWWLSLALPLALVPLARTSPRRRPALAIALAGALALVGWLVTSQTARYALPVALVVAILAAVGAALLRPTVARLAAVVLLVAVGHGIASLGGFLFGPLGLATALRSVEEWRAAVTINDPAPVYRAATPLISGGDRVLVVGEGRGWGCPGPYHVSSPYDRQLLETVVDVAASPADVATRLRRDGFTHLVVNWGEVRRLGGPDYRVLRVERPAQRAVLRGFLSDHTVVVWRAGDLEVRALAGPGAP